MIRDSKESVLSRWSRRKLETQEATEQSVPRAEPMNRTTEASAIAPANEPQEAPPLTDADMPDIESLTEESDFSGFMSKGVSDELRNLALRKLFKSSVFNIRDGLDEYDEDYTTFEKLGDIVTADMKHELEMQAQKLREALAQEAETSPDEASEDLEAIGDEDESEELTETIAEVDLEPGSELKDEQ